MDTRHEMHEEPAASLERRRHFRVKTDLRVVWAIEATGERGEAALGNIGMGGAKVEFPRQLEVATTVTLTLLDDEEEQLSVDGEVAWTTMARTEGPFPVGLAFSGLDGETRRRLFRWIESLITA